MNKDSVLQWVKEPGTKVCVTGGDAFNYARSINDGNIEIKFLDTMKAVDEVIDSEVTSPTIYVLSTDAKKGAKKFDHWLMTMPGMGCYGHISKVKE